MLHFGQIHLAIWTNTFCNLGKYILQFGQIHFAIWTNTFCNLDKYKKMQIVKMADVDHMSILTKTRRRMKSSAKKDEGSFETH